MRRTFLITLHAPRCGMGNHTVRDNRGSSSQSPTLGLHVCHCGGGPAPDLGMDMPVSLPNRYHGNAPAGGSGPQAASAREQSSWIVSLTGGGEGGLTPCFDQCFRTEEFGPPFNSTAFRE